MSKTKTKEVKTLESYFQTSNDWHNEKSVAVIAEIKRKGLFEEMQTPMDLYNLGIEAFEKDPDSPIKAVEILNQAFAKQGFQEEQSLFILEKIEHYLSYTVWEEIAEEKKEIFLTIFKAEVSSRKGELAKKKPPKPEVQNLRMNLKEILNKELEKLPEYLEELETKDKLNFICKMMPFVLPKVQTVDSEYGEKPSFTW